MSAAPQLFDPRLSIPDPVPAYWLRQVTLRLRRETAWCWQQRSGQAGALGLPPLADPALESLDLTRYELDKQRFFREDVAARYLSEQIAVARPRLHSSPSRGSWEWVAVTLGLDDAAQFVFALGLAARLDAALGAVCSACLNDANRPYPTLALAQRLWDLPEAIISCGHTAHPLFRYGLLSWDPSSAAGLEWSQPLAMHGWVAQTLLDPAAALPPALKPLKPSAEGLAAETELYAARLQTDPPQALEVVPLLGPRGADWDRLAGALATRLGGKLARLHEAAEPDRVELGPLATRCWLQGYDILLPEDWPARNTPAAHAWWGGSVLVLPLRWFAPVTDLSVCHSLPSFAVLPPLRIAALGYEQRRDLFQRALGIQAQDLDGAIKECARRFRFEAATIARVGRTLQAQPVLQAEQIFAVCRQEQSIELGHLAQPVAPRFMLDEVILPAAQTLQLAEIRQAMGALTEVHYGWGTARVWNEAGLSVLFGGPPGTGKTMAAEALGLALALPMYRIDLSQVVNKYIGETEKNLKRIFDVAEQSDCILFFDEADALFGKRTEAKDAHDRFANIEISYLLERMERFKGLAILATNRKKDLDEAFLRRLRYIVDFPLPGVAERERIWRGVFPGGVDLSEVDFHYLAKQFSISGGHIRSIAFNTCLQSAARGDRRITMPVLLIAVKREFDKLNRAAHAELFGSYAPLIRELTA